MTAETLEALWALAGPIQPHDREGITSARVDQLLRLSVEERRRLIHGREQKAALRQEGRTRWLH